MQTRIFVVALLVLTSSPPRSQDRGGSLDSDSFLQAQLPSSRPRDVSARVRDLLARMTLKEKIGQMTQLEIGMVSDGVGLDLHINPAKLQKAVGEYGVGSILNVHDRALPIARWHEIIRAIQAAAASTRLKIPVVYGLDTIHGANYIEGATIFPQPLGMAATWNPELVLDGSRIAAAETRAAGIPWNFSPVLDIGRQPLWPRLYETYGEDPYLATVMGVATVRGYQGTDPSAPDRVGATLKHFVGYSFPHSGQDRTPAIIPDAMLREYFLPTFAAGIKAGAVSVMVNSASVNGVPGHIDAHLLKDVLRGELGFDGLVVSDWQDIKGLVTTHHAAANEKEATKIAVLAGIDMSMVPSDYSFAELLRQLVDEGAVPMARIDEAVGRVLTMKARLGLFDDPLRGIRDGAQVGLPASRDVARQAARESLVLLKNERGLLPLAASTRVLVTGPTADSLPALNNGWTITWQGDRASAYPDRPTVRKALETRLGASRVRYVAGTTYDRDTDTAAAVAAARDADAIVLCLGEMTYAETPGNIENLNLPDAQLKLADALAATGKPIVLVLIEGRPRIVRPIVDRASAILLALNPGHEGGTAIADVLSGDVSPSGRLPITYPRQANVLVPYDQRADDAAAADRGSGRPQFEFGTGLAYTTFEYSGLTTTAATGGPAGASDVSVTVRNTGSRAGAVVVQLYVSPPAGSGTAYVRRLRRFAKLTLAAGQGRPVHFKISRDEAPAGSTVWIGSLTKPVRAK
ncbi:MAG TPA: glycoside hydrolase family 3 N-terminal domain-containing protein [Vicinamibacterales bacterium]|nr:glycoside hydrolase family 3 N-terminal domain-containing protein [Vicinamibacterales bacterium]